MIANPHLEASAPLHADRSFPRVGVPPSTRLHRGPVQGLPLSPAMPLASNKTRQSPVRLKLGEVRNDRGK